jgi:hypothetical protein
VFSVKTRGNHSQWNKVSQSAVSRGGQPTPADQSLAPFSFGKVKGGKSQTLLRLLSMLDADEQHQG